MNVVSYAGHTAPDFITMTKTAWPATPSVRPADPPSPVPVTRTLDADSGVIARQLAPLTSQLETLWPSAEWAADEDHNGG